MNHLKIKFIFVMILSFFNVNTFAQLDVTPASGETVIVDEQIDILLSDPYLSLKYQRGAYLVYDCFDKHWVCTGEPEYNQCDEARDLARKEFRSKYPCASFKVFSDERQCNTVQTRLTNRGYYEQFCLTDIVKEIDRYN